MNPSRVAIGANSSKCVVNEKFRVIVIADIEAAYSNKIPPPLLNRFEKQALTFRNLLTPETMGTAAVAISEIIAMVDKIGHWAASTADPYSPQQVFVGYSEDNVASMVLHLNKQYMDTGEVIEQVQQQLLHTITPETIVRYRDLFSN